MSVEDYANSTARITTATTTQVTTEDSVLKWLVFPADLLGSVTVYDDASANNNTVVVFPTGALSGVWVIGRYMERGIRVVTGAADEVVVVYTA